MNITVINLIKLLITQVLNIIQPVKHGLQLLIIQSNLAKHIKLMI
jgi:hypothetical protein